jgi:hypothetical protein
MGVSVTDQEVVIDLLPRVTGKVVRVDTTTQHSIHNRSMLHRLIDEILDERLTGEIRMNSNRGGVGFLLVVRREKA